MPHAARGWPPALLAASLVALAAGPVAGAEQDQFEERMVQHAAGRAAERTFRAGKSDRGQWLKVLEAVYPDKVTEKLTSAAAEADYGVWFDLLAGKNDEWKRADSPPQVAELFDRVTQRMELGPVPSIRREEFMKFAKRSLAPGSPPNGAAPDALEEADKVFRALDKDTDGELGTDELTLSLKEEKVKSDGDGNGRISKEEYREYFRRRVASKVDAFVAKLGEGRGGDGKPPVKGGKPGLGDGLPDWFNTLDEDRDAQVSLYEWRKADRPVDVYVGMDLNGDGLLTRDEYLRWLKMNENSRKKEK